MLIFILFVTLMSYNSQNLLRMLPLTSPAGRNGPLLLDIPCNIAMSGLTIYSLVKQPFFPIRGPQYEFKPVVRAAPAPITAPVTTRTSSVSAPASPRPLLLSPPPSTSSTITLPAEGPTTPPAQPAELPPTYATAAHPAGPTPAPHGEPEPSLTTESEEVVASDAGEAPALSPPVGMLRRHLARVRLFAAELSMRRIVLVIQEFGAANIGGGIARVQSLGLPAAATGVFTPLLELSASAYGKARSYMATLLDTHQELADTVTIDDPVNTTTVATCAAPSVEAPTPVSQPMRAPDSAPYPIIRRNITESAYAMEVVGRQRTPTREELMPTSETLPTPAGTPFGAIRLRIGESWNQSKDELHRALKRILEETAILVMLFHLWRGLVILVHTNSLVHWLRRFALPKQRNLGRAFDPWAPEGTRLLAVVHVVIWSPLEVDGVMPEVAPNAWTVLADDVSLAIRAALHRTIRPVLNQTDTLTRFLRRFGPPPHRDMSRSFDANARGTRLLSILDIITWSPLEVDGVTPAIAPNAWTVLADEAGLAVRSTFHRSIRPALDCGNVLLRLLFYMPEHRDMARSFDPDARGTRLLSILDVITWSPLEVDGLKLESPPNAWPVFAADCKAAARSVMDTIATKAAHYVNDLTRRTKQPRALLHRLACIAISALLGYANTIARLVAHLANKAYISAPSPRNRKRSSPSAKENHREKRGSKYSSSVAEPNRKAQIPAICTTHDEDVPSTPFSHKKRAWIRRKA